MGLKIAILISNNGLGHIKRNITLAESLSKTYNVTLFAKKKKISKFKVNKKIKIKNLNFNSQQKFSVYNKKIHRFIKIKGNFDLHLSDNYPEAVLNNHRTFIISNFFWHNLLKIDNNYYRSIEKKIKKTIVISNYLFCSKEIRDKYEITPTGFYGNFNKKKFSKKAKGILFSFGTANKDIDFFIKKFLKSLKIKNKHPIFIDSKFYNKKLINYNIHKANYSKEMFSKIAIAIIKPGLGIITDCLSYGITILSHEHKLYNQEFLFNSKVLNKNNLSKNFKNLHAALKFANTLISNNSYRKRIYYLSKKLKWNGEKTILKVINKYFKYCSSNNTNKIIN
jgi:spore coat polysaccharide biosynthesis predicted glycosyltransferase SpsG